MDQWNSPYPTLFYGRALLRLEIRHRCHDVAAPASCLQTHQTVPLLAILQRVLGNATIVLCFTNSYLPLFQSLFACCPSPLPSPPSPSALVLRSLSSPPVVGPFSFLPSLPPLALPIRPITTSFTSLSPCMPGPSLLPLILIASLFTFHGHPLPLPQPLPPPSSSLSSPAGLRRLDLLPFSFRYRSSWVSFPPLPGALPSDRLTFPYRHRSSGLLLSFSLPGVEKGRGGDRGTVPVREGEATVGGPSERGGEETQGVAAVQGREGKAIWGEGGH